MVHAVSLSPSSLLSLLGLAEGGRHPGSQTKIRFFKYTAQGGAFSPLDLVIPCNLQSVLNLCPAPTLVLGSHFDYYLK